MRQIVNADLSDSKVNDNDIQVDTTPQSVEEKTQQEEVIKAMEDNKPATVSEPVTEKTDEVVETQPTVEEKPEESADNYGKVIDTEIKEEPITEEKKVEEEKKPEVDLAKIEAEVKQKAFDEFMGKYKPNDQKTENIRLYKQNQELQEKLKGLDTNTYLATEKQKNIYEKFCDSHKDLISEQSKKSLIAYQTIGDENLITNDETLFRLDKELKKIAQVNSENPLVDLEDRLESAYWLAFRDKIIDSKVKQTQVKIEMEKQKTDKVVEDGYKSTSATISKNYSPEQQKVADAWGVKLN
jgi:hypothetical protein